MTQAVGLTVGSPDPDGTKLRCMYYTKWYKQLMEGLFNSMFTKMIRLGWY